VRTPSEQKAERITGKEQQLGTSRAALYGSLHQCREAKLVALVYVDVTEMPQQEIHGIIVSWINARRQQASTQNDTKCIVKPRQKINRQPVSLTRGRTDRYITNIENNRHRKYLPVLFICSFKFSSAFLVDRVYLSRLLAT